MANNGVLLRAGRAAAVSAALIALVAACSNGSPQSTATPTAPAPLPSSSGGTPGGLTAQASGVSITISDAVAHLGSSGTRELTMTIRNDGDVPEHLAMVATAGAGRATLQGVSTGNGSLSTAGVLLLAHSTVVFGGNGPRVLLPAVPGAGSTLPLTMQFGVVGLVHLQAKVAGA